MFRCAVQTFLILVLWQGTGFQAMASSSSCDQHLGGTWKLIRDRLPEIYLAEGDQTQVVQISRAELLKFLYQKLQEEILEFRENPSAEEMADIHEVLSALQNFHNIDRTEVEWAKLEKFLKKGGFSQGYVIRVSTK